MALPSTSATHLRSLRRQRPRRSDGRAGNQRCAIIFGIATFVSLMCCWLWFLHWALSSTSGFSGGEVVLPPLPDPMFPPDMKNDPSFHPPPKEGSSLQSPPLMLTWQSNQHKFNQDRAVLYSRFATRQMPPDDNEEASFLVGLFDGHGRDGHLMAQYVTEHFAKVLAEKLNSQPCCQSDDWIAAQLNATFFAMEINAVALWESSNRTLDFGFTGGCTATVTLRQGKRLFFANAGDSRTMLAANFENSGKAVDDPYVADILYSTRLDKPHLEDERARIEGLGGNVFIPAKGSFNPSRVVQHSEHLQDTVGLAMSRSLGDREWTAVGVTPEPIVDVVRLDRDPAASSIRPYLIVASDGMWDCRARRPQFFAKQLGALLFETPGSNMTTMTLKLKEFLHRITPQQPQFDRDDITVVAFPVE